MNNQDLPKLTKFLLCPDEETKELYILHREYPACLILVKQETPIRFIVMDLFDDVKDEHSILEMPFVQEAKDYFKNYVINSLDIN